MQNDILTIAGSYQHTINAIISALINEAELEIKNAYPALSLKHYQELLIDRGWQLVYQNGSLLVSKCEAKPVASFRESCEINDLLALHIAISGRYDLNFKRSQDEDFERRILIVRRMGVEFAEADPQQRSRNLKIKSFKPAHIKFNFLKSNYYLFEYMACLGIINDQHPEYISDYDLGEWLENATYPLAYELENLHKPEENLDELEKRLRRMKGKQNKATFHYRISRAKNVAENTVTLPADPVVSAYASVMACLVGEKTIAIGPFLQSGSDKAFQRILGKFGIKADFEQPDKKTVEYFLKLDKNKPVAKKIDEDLMRACNYAFAPLALLAIFAEGKTLLRGLAFSSSKWRARIDGVAKILTGAGVRVGEIEDGLVIEPPLELGEISHIEFSDPYLQLFQMAAAHLLNSHPPGLEFFEFVKNYPHFKACLENFKGAAKYVASH